MFFLDAVREWRKSGGNQAPRHNAPQAVYDVVPSPTVLSSRKKQKTSLSVPPQSYSSLLRKQGALRSSKKSLICKFTYHNNSKERLSRN